VTADCDFRTKYRNRQSGFIRLTSGMRRIMLGYSLCAVIAAATLASGTIHVYRDCCQKHISLTQLNTQGCDAHQSQCDIQASCCTPLFSHRLALTPEVAPKVHDTHVFIAIAGSFSVGKVLANYLEINSRRIRIFNSESWGAAPPIFQKYLRILI
jgi:hypothetical protein